MERIPGAIRRTNEGSIALIPLKRVITKLYESPQSITERWKCNGRTVIMRDGTEARENEPRRCTLVARNTPLHPS